jgi:hypothetical protein
MFAQWTVVHQYVNAHPYTPIVSLKTRKLRFADYGILGQNLQGFYFLRLYANFSEVS